jgi:integrase
MGHQHRSAVEYTLGNFEAWAEGLQMDEVTVQVMKEYRERNQVALNAKTVNNHLSIISSFFKWAQEQGYSEDNPAEGMTIRTKTRRSKQRKAFSGQQIQEILGPLATGHWDAKGVKCWIPLIMAYSGARPEEIAQLRCGDLKTVHVPGRGMHGKGFHPDWMWVFDFETEEHGQRRKSEASKRFVPIHQRLIQLGILNLTEEDGPDDVLLFPDLTKNKRGRLSENASRWFNRTWLRSHCGIIDEKLVLYSIRHSVATRLKHRGAPEEIIAQLLGHEHPNITNGRYGKEYPVETMNEWIKQLDWGV